MAKEMGLAVAITASIGGAIRGFKTVMGEVTMLDKVLDRLSNKKIALLENIDKAYAPKIDSLKQKLESLRGYESTLKARIKVEDKEIQELRRKLSQTKRSISDLEDRKLDLKRVFKEGAIGAEEFEKEMAKVQKRLHALSQKKLGLSQKLDEARHRADLLKGRLERTKEIVKRLSAKRLRLINDLEAAKKRAQEANGEFFKLGQTIKKLEEHRISLKNISIKRDQFRSKLFDTVAIGASVAFPIKKAIEFESAMADVAKVANLSREETKKFGAELARLSTKIPLSAKGLAQIAASGAQLGIAKEKLVSFTNVVAKMSTAFDMSAESAGQSIAKLMNVYGIGLAGVTRLGDAINHLSDNTAAKAKDMVEVLARIGGTAKMFGLGATQAAALADAFLAMGKTPEVASTAINALLNRLSTADKQGKKFQAALQSIGLDSYKIKMEIASNPQKAILKVLQAIKQVDKESRMGVLTDLFGTEYADDIALLVGGLENYRKAIKLTADQSSYLGSMQREFENRSKTTANQLHLLQNSLSRIGIALGSVVLPPLSQLAKAGASIANWVASFNERFPIVGKAISYAAVGLGTFAVTSATVGYAATFLLGGLTRLKIASLLLSNALSLSSLRAKALTFWSGALASGARIAAGAKMAWSAASSALTGTLSVLGGALRFVGSGALWLGRALMANPIGLAIGAIAGGAYLIYRYWEPIKGFFSSLWGGVKSIFSNALSGIKRALSFSPIGIVFRAFAPLSSFFGSLWSSISGVFKKGVGYITSLFLHPVRTIKSLFSDLFGWLAKKLGWVGSALKKVFDFGAKIGSAIKGFFGGEHTKHVGEVLKKSALTTGAAATIATSAVALPEVPSFEPAVHNPTIMPKVGSMPSIEPKVKAPEPIVPKIYQPAPVVPKVYEPAPMRLTAIEPKITKVPKIEPAVHNPTIMPKIGAMPSIEPKVKAPEPIKLAVMETRKVDHLLPRLTTDTTLQSVDRSVSITVNFGDIVIHDGESVKEKIKEQIQKAIDEIDFNRFQGDLYDVV